MRILITGGNGFIGSNLRVRLSESANYEYVTYSHTNPISSLERKSAGIDAVIHLAGVNRPADVSEFGRANRDFTEALCRTLERHGKPVHIIFASSSQAVLDNPYGRSKLAAENILENFAIKTGCKVTNFRLPNVFGKWCRPEYNSVVATFCHKIANDQEIDIHDAAAPLRLVFVDDVITSFLHVLSINPSGNYEEAVVDPEYSITVGGLAETLHQFRSSRDSLLVDGVGNGLKRALYATYLSYLRPEQFSYGLVSNTDERGRFVEVLKTLDSGQFSFFTASPGATRGGHYHHTKTEKFLVVQGEALFKFRHLISNDSHEIKTSAEEPVVVETIPGWVHDITNVGSNELIVLLWANEIFDKNKPDTVKATVNE